MKKAVSLLLALALSLGLAVPALADQSTTTVRTAYKDLDPRTEIYAVTKTPGSDYPYYGAKNEPNGGVYYGRTTQGGTLGDGSFGLANYSHMTGESAVSFYYSLTDSYNLEYWSYLYGPALRDGTRAFLLYLNFEEEGAECPRIVSGSYDAKLIETFGYLNTLSCPVFVRIGGEMNVWGNQAKPADFIAAYQHVVNIARSQAPRAAMVFSPNYSSANKVDMDVYYPGDQYVDWVGASLYYDRWHHSGDTKRDEFYGVGAYGDALLNIQQVVNLSRLHHKPVIVTEGGSCNQYKGTDNSAWAADRMQRAYAFLPMVYPEVKCIISSDYGESWSGIDYSFYTNPTVTAAYRQGVASNAAYVRNYQDKGSYYTKLSAYTGKWEGVMELAAYSWSSDKQTATWTVDGQVMATAADYPYSFRLDTAALATGSHTVAVTFSDGATKSYAFQTTAPAILASNNAQVDGWAKDQVNEAIASGLVAAGLGEDYRVNITRAQFAATTVKLYEAMSGERVPAAAENPFTDTSDPVILQAAELGFVYGITDDTFAPDSLVTREQAAAMLSRVYTKLGGELPAVEATTFDDDGSVSDWARDAVAFMSDKGIVSGMGDNCFDPQGSASIEQALSIVLRMFKNLK
ncbi:MAG: hypothetical protein HFF51_05550 [Lawsonibacter sp.]|nr:hypothetical protein [Lawsonibacter sp.]